MRKHILTLVAMLVSIVSVSGCTNTPENTGQSGSYMTIDAAYSIGSVGTVISAKVEKGTLAPGSVIHTRDGDFVVKSIEINHSPVSSAPAGSVAAVSVEGGKESFPNGKYYFD